jgi:hypothetical protein
VFVQTLKHYKYVRKDMTSIAYSIAKESAYADLALTPS